MTACDKSVQVTGLGTQCNRGGNSRSRTNVLVSTALLWTRESLGGMTFAASAEIAPESWPPARGFLRKANPPQTAPQTKPDGPTVCRPAKVHACQEHLVRHETPSRSKTIACLPIYLVKRYYYHGEVYNFALIRSPGLNAIFATSSMHSLALPKLA